MVKVVRVRRPIKKKKVNKELIMRALIDPKFRRMLARNPRKAVGVSKLSNANRVEIKFVLAAVKAIEGQIADLADELLCAYGGRGIVG